MDKAKVLTGCELARDLGPEQVEKLASISVVKEYDGGDSIIREDDTTRDIFILVDGWVTIEIQRYSSDISVPRLQLLKNRGVVGEFSFVDGSRRSANVTASEKARLLMLPYERMKKLMEADPRLGYTIMKNIAVQLCARIRFANSEMSSQLIW
ncbi:MAG: Crp/Fnr family transcriptional regulator [Candidatus Nitrospinota bacterium M3_3B_026]